MNFLKKLPFIFINLLGIVGLVSAQGECPPTVDDALLALNDICLATGRNQACYGNGDIVAIPQTGTNINFNIPGDTAIVDDIQTMTLSPFSNAIEDWGVALLVLQADLPATLPGQNVTMLLFGDVMISQDTGAYYFTSGIGTPTCSQAPSGVLIQTTEGAGTINVTVNGINISLGSTAYLGTLEEDILTFALLEGSATLFAEDSENEVTLEPEQFTSIELDENHEAVGEFTEPEDIDELDFGNLPLFFLPRDITETDDEDSSSDSSTASGDRIIPRQGDWLITLEQFQFGDACPSFLGEDVIRQTMGELGYGSGTVQEITFNDFDIDALFDTGEFVGMGMDANIDTSTPNVYVITITIPEAGSVTYTWNIVSETYMEGDLVQNLELPGMGTCVVTVPYTFEYQG